MGTHQIVLTRRELSNEYQHDRVWMIFKNICVLVLRLKVASALEGLKVLCIETTASMGMLQKFEIAASEFKEALGSWLQLISSPEAGCDKNSMDGFISP